MNATETPGSGVANADFVLYVAAKNTRTCKRHKIYAHSRPCQLEPILDRYNDE